jgi:DNA-binding PadR family transcriptional regulator
MSRGEHLGEFEQVVLLAVAQLGGTGYGVTVRQEIQRRTGRRVSLGAVYSTLVRAEEKGYVAGFEGESTSVRGGRAKRHYRLLPAGAGALKATRRMLDRMWEDVDLDPRPGSA